MTRRAESGFTLVEMAIALAIVGLVLMNLSMVVRTGAKGYADGVLRSLVEDQASLTMDRISLAVMSSRSEAMIPTAVAPYATSTIEYTVELGTSGEGGAVEQGSEKIEYDQAQGQIVWSQLPDTAPPRSVVWTRWVPSLLEGEGEVANGADDNANGLIDEGGLSFDKIGTRVNIHLTLRRTDAEGRTYVKTLRSVVACRN